MKIDPLLRFLDDIWILRKEGTVLFHRVVKEGVDDQLIGSLMSAIDSFARMIDGGGLTNFQIGYKNYILRKEKDIYFLASCPLKSNLKKAQDALIFISRQFLLAYHDELDSFNGDIVPFKRFEEKLNAPMDYYWMLM